MVHLAVVCRWISNYFLSVTIKGKIDIQEIYGSHYVLPELGPLGGNGLANVRDFESPVASFDIDQRPWNSKSTFYGIDRLPIYLTIIVVYK